MVLQLWETLLLHRPDRWSLQTHRSGHWPLEAASWANSSSLSIVRNSPCSITVVDKGSTSGLHRCTAAAMVWPKLESSHTHMAGFSLTEFCDLDDSCGGCRSGSQIPGVRQRTCSATSIKLARLTGKTFLAVALDSMALKARRTHRS